MIVCLYKTPLVSSSGLMTKINTDKAEYILMYVSKIQISFQYTKSCCWGIITRRKFWYLTIPEKKNNRTCSLWGLVSTVFQEWTDTRTSFYMESKQVDTEVVSLRRKWMPNKVFSFTMIQWITEYIAVRLYLVILTINVILS